MRKSNQKSNLSATKLIVFVVLALFPSLFISRTTVSYNASPCLSDRICKAESIGTIEVKELGFPSPYDQTTTFIPNDSTIGGFVDQHKDKDYLFILTNMYFWTSVFVLTYMFVSRFMLSRKKNT